MSRNHAWYGTLLKAAQQRGISLPPVEAEDLSDAQMSGITTWINDNLEFSEPLTLEELTIWQKICNKSGRPHYVESHDKLGISPVNEYTLREEIQSLDSSTRDIETRLAILQYQRNDLASLHSENSHHQQSRYRGSSSETRHETEKQQLFFLNNETEAQVQTSINGSQQQLAKAAKALALIVRDRLNEDDHTLDLLNQIISSTIYTSTKWDSSAESLLNALRTAISLSIKVHLDQVYCSNIENAKHPFQINERSVGLEQIYGDLNSLYAEIEAITSMVVDIQHGDKLRAVEEGLRNATEQCINQNALQVMHGLEALTRSKSYLASQFQHLHAHKMTLDVIDNLCRSYKNREELSELCSGPIIVKSLDQRVETLLHHLNTQRPGKVDAELLSRQGFDTWPCSQIVLDQLLADVRESREVGKSRLQQLFATSETQLIEAAQHNEILDQQIASAKFRLETAANAPDLTFDVRQQLNGNTKRT